jgi:hypothetical protein
VATDPEIPGSIPCATRFSEIVGLERGPLSLVRITDELPEWRSSGSGSRKPRLTAVGIRCAVHATPSILKKLSLTSPTSGGRSVSIVRLWTEATELVFKLKAQRGDLGMEWIEETFENVNWLEPAQYCQW